MSQVRAAGSSARRLQLLKEALVFVEKAQGIPGITRIALIGSLTTHKATPKDVDLLVTVMDDADLAPLATLGRKLQGHTLSFGSGGEVFLTNPQGQYVGRICPWKECKPGIRMSCDALHCGQRPYLHDDFPVFQLREEFIVTPPIELWPQIVLRVPVPNDVEEHLILPLRRRIGAGMC
jgi:predicted nucleotidyltransferase